MRLIFTHENGEEGKVLKSRLLIAQASGCSIGALGLFALGAQKAEGWDYTAMQTDFPHQEA